MTLQSELDSLLHSARVPGLDRDHLALLTALDLGSSGGKRFRPWLVTTVHAAFGGDQTDTVVDAVAAATELLHTAFVIHDDVIDNDDTRRGRPSVPGLFRSDAAELGTAPDDHDTYARAGAILAGDLALAAAIRAVATCGVDPVTTHRLLDLLDATLHASAAGELADVRLALGAAMPSADEAIAVTEHKTAVYSFVLPLQAGAVLAGADESAVRVLGEIGRLPGDRLPAPRRPAGDVRGPRPHRQGHPRRPPRGQAHAAHGARPQTPDWARIAPHLGDPDLTEAAAAGVREALDACGSPDLRRGPRRRPPRVGREHARTLDLERTLFDPLVAQAWRMAASPQDATAQVGAA